MAAMRYRRLGTSGLKVSELCLGTMMFGGPTQEAEAHRIIAHARDGGVNFIDTADAYAEGRSEATIGPAIKADRDRWVLASKVGNKVGSSESDQGLSRRHVLRSLEASLKRLQTDRIDLYYVHRLDPATSWEQTIATFGELIRQGKIREWGLSNVRGWQLAHVCNLCRAMHVPQPVALQPYYNLMNRQPEVELLPAARFFDLGVVPYSPLARGVLSGKYALNVAPAADSRAGRKDRRILEAEWRTESLDIAAKLKAHAASRGATLVAWAVAWVLNNQTVSSAIAGPRTFEQWTQYFAALDYRWTAEDEVLADKLVTPGHPSTPGYNDPQYPLDGRFPAVA